MLWLVALLAAAASDPPPPPPPPPPLVSLPRDYFSLFANDTSRTATSKAKERTPKHKTRKSKDNSFDFFNSFVDAKQKADEQVFVLVPVIVVV